MTDEWVVLSVTQPWASALCMGIKLIETRSWPTNYRGRLYIHASKGYPRWARELAPKLVGPGPFPLGAIIGHVELVDVRKTEELLPIISPQEESLGDYDPHRFGWMVTNPVMLPEPIPAVGRLGLWRFQR